MSEFILLHCRTDKVQSLTDSVEKEQEARSLAEKQARDASLRVDVLSSYFNEKEKEFDRYLLFSTLALHKDLTFDFSDLKFEEKLGSEFEQMIFWKHLR